MLSRLHRRGVATPDCCSHAPPAARDVCAAPLAPGHPREGGQALDRSAAANALPLEAALLHLDTDFELHRLSHRPGDAAVSRPTTRRVLVVPSDSTVRTERHFRFGARRRWRLQVRPAGCKSSRSQRLLLLNRRAGVCHGRSQTHVLVVLRGSDWPCPFGDHPDVRIAHIRGDAGGRAAFPSGTSSRMTRGSAPTARCSSPARPLRQHPFVCRIVSDRWLS